MRYFYLIIMFLVGGYVFADASKPATAQDNVIRIIGTDGSVVEVDIGTPSGAAPPPSAGGGSTSEDNLARPDAAQKAPTPSERAKPELSSPQPKQAEPEPQSSVEDTVRSPHPSQSSLSGDAKSTPESAQPIAIQPIAVSEVKSEDTLQAAPRPAHKPRLVREVVQPEAVQALEPVIQEAATLQGYTPNQTPSPSGFALGQSGITKERALFIALDNGAPPARSVQILPRNIDGREIFVVRFRTEDGLRDMLIDRLDGELIQP